MESLAAAAGQVMLLAGGAVIVVALAAVVPRALRAQRKAVALRRTVRAGRYEIASAVEMLALQRAETDALLAPWRRIWRWARHPLVVATLQWYLRQRRARRRRRLSSAGSSVLRQGFQPWPGVRQLGRRSE